MTAIPRTVLVPAALLALAVPVAFALDDDEEGLFERYRPLFVQLCDDALEGDDDCAAILDIDDDDDDDDCEDMRDLVSECRDDLDFDHFSCRVMDALADDACEDVFDHDDDDDDDDDDDFDLDDLKDEIEDRRDDHEDDIEDRVDDLEDEIEDRIEDRRDDRR